MLSKSSIFYNYIYIKELIAILLVCLVITIKFKRPIITSILVIFILIIAFFFRNNLSIKKYNYNNAFLSPVIFSPIEGNMLNDQKS